MKATPLKYTAGLFIAALSFSLQNIQAQDTPSTDQSTAPAPAPDQGTTPPPAPPEHGDHDHFGFLSPQERAQLRKDRESVMSANPDLKTQADDLKSEGKALRADPNATPEDKKAFMEKRMAFEKSVNDAILKLDPSAQPILDKIAAHHKQH